MRVFVLAVAAVSCLAACGHSGHGRWELMKGGSEELGPFLDTTSVQLVGPDVVQAAVKVIYPEPRQLDPGIGTALSVRVVRVFHCKAGTSATLGHHVYADREQAQEIYKHEEALGEVSFKAPASGSQEELIAEWVCSKPAS